MVFFKKTKGNWKGNTRTLYAADEAPDIAIVRGISRQSSFYVADLKKEKFVSHAFRSYRNALDCANYLLKISKEKDVSISEASLELSYR